MWGKKGKGCYDCVEKPYKLWLCYEDWWEGLITHIFALRNLWAFPLKPADNIYVIQTQTKEKLPKIMKKLLWNHQKCQII